MDIARLVAEHHQAVYRYAYRLTGSVPDAEDLTQQVFLAAHQKAGQIRQEDSVRSWLFTVLRNRFFKSLAQKRGPVVVQDGVSIDQLPAEIPGDEAIDREELQRAIDLLPPEFRVVLLMFYFEDCSYREIAAALELPIGTVMSRLARAKAHLRRRLFPAVGNEPPPESSPRPSARVECSSDSF